MRFEYSFLRRRRWGFFGKLNFWRLGFWPRQRKLRHHLSRRFYWSDRSRRNIGARCYRSRRLRTGWLSERLQEFSNAFSIRLGLVRRLRRPRRRRCRSFIRVRVFISVFARLSRLARQPAKQQRHHHQQNENRIVEMHRGHFLLPT